MKDFVIFRQLNQIEKEIIKNSISKISSNFLSNFRQIEKLLFIFIKEQTSYKIFPKIYLLSEELKNLLNTVKIYNYISLGGLYFGFIKKGRFYLSLEGTEYLYKRGLLSDVAKLQVNKRGEKSILYGNNVLKNMLIKKSYNFKENDYILVFNEDEEIIAISKTTLKGSQVQYVKPENLIAFNLSDKGTYLRENQ